MGVLQLLKNRAAGDFVVADDDDNEFLQIINALSGVSTDKCILVSYSHATDAPVTADQQGAGLLFKGTLNGVQKYSVENDGQIRTAATAPSNAADVTRKDYVDGRKVTTVHHFFKSGVLATGELQFGVLIVPSGATEFKVLLASFAHWTNNTIGVTTIAVTRRRSGADTVLGTITVPDPTVVKTVVTQDFADDTSTAGDIIFFNVTAVGGTPPSDTSLTVVTEQKLRS